MKLDTGIRRYKTLQIIPECKYREDGMCHASKDFVHKCDCPTCALLGTDRCVKVRDYGQRPNKEGDCAAN